MCTVVCESKFFMWSQPHPNHTHPIEALSLALLILPLNLTGKEPVLPTAAHKEYEQQRSKLVKLIARLEAKWDFIDTKRQELERLKSIQDMEIDTTLSDSITKLKMNTEQNN